MNWAGTVVQLVFPKRITLKVQVVSGWPCPWLVQAQSNEVCLETNACKADMCRRVLALSSWLGSEGA